MSKQTAIHKAKRLARTFGPMTVFKSHGGMWTVAPLGVAIESGSSFKIYR